MQFQLSVTEILFLSSYFFALLFAEEQERREELSGIHVKED